MPVENQPQAESKLLRKPRFWIGPVVAGSCFALGFGVTQRFVARQGRHAPAAQQSFHAHRFPGDSLERLTMARTGMERPLLADVAAREAELAKTRPLLPKKKDDKAKQEAARLANEARLRRERMAAIRAPVVPAAAVTGLDESVQMPALELPPQGVTDEAGPELPQLPAAVALPDLGPGAVDPREERPVPPAISSPLLNPVSTPVPFTVPSSVAPTEP